MLAIMGFTSEKYPQILIASLLNFSYHFKTSYAVCFIQYNAPAMCVMKQTISILIRGIVVRMDDFLDLQAVR